MPHECEELSETMVGHETISLLLLMQDFILYLRTRQRGILWEWERKGI